MNRVIMMGRIVNDLELKTTPQGLPVCSFRIAVDRRYQKKGEERKTDFFNVVAWRQSAEFVTRWFAKGRMILVEGEMTTRQYTDKNGNPNTWYEIVAENLYFTGEKASTNNGGSYGPPSYGDPPGGYGGSYQGGSYQGGQGGSYQGGQGGAYQGGSGQGGSQGDQGGSSQGGAPSDFSSASNDDYPF